MMKDKNTRNKISCIFILTKVKTASIICMSYGEVAQLARAFGSYPKCHVCSNHIFATN